MSLAITSLLLPWLLKHKGLHESTVQIFSHSARLCPLAALSSSLPLTPRPHLETHVIFSLQSPGKWFLAYMHSFTRKLSQTTRMSWGHVDSRKILETRTNLVSLPMWSSQHGEAVRENGIWGGDSVWVSGA